MSKGDWRFLVILGGIIAASVITFAIGVALEPKCFADSAVWKANSEAQHSDSGAAYSGQVTCNADCQVRFGFAESKPPTGDGASNPEGENDSADQSALPPVEERDLCAQTRVAWWTRIIAFWTAVGAGLLFWTLWETRREIEANRKSIREQLSIENRAWIFADGILPQRFAEKKPPALLGFRFLVNWENKGKTPAVQSQMWGSYCILNPGEPIPKTFTRNKSEIVAATIGPGTKFTLDPLGISVKDLGEVAAKKKRLLLWGFQQYKTVFDDVIRETAVCFEIVCNGGPENLTAEPLHPDFFSYHLIGDHNYAT